jgi:hypothetical protein
MESARIIKGRSIDGRERSVRISYAHWVCITIAVGGKPVAVEVPYRELRTALEQVSPPKPTAKKRGKSSN